jgi:integrase-like protein
VHHSDRGFQYGCAEYIAIIEQYRMVLSMSRPVNPYDYASCESFMKTLKREEIHANLYEDLGHMRVNIEEFIEQFTIGSGCTQRWVTFSRKNSNSKLNLRGWWKPLRAQPSCFSEHDEDAPQIFKQRQVCPSKTVSLKGCSR